jgi:hypothetical protein
MIVDTKPPRFIRGGFLLCAFSLCDFAMQCAAGERNSAKRNAG